MRDDHSLDCQDKIDRILSWSQNKRFFDEDFVLTLQDKLQDFGYLTEAQEQALDNIIEKFNIP